MSMFANTVSRLNRGHTIAQLDDALQSLTQQVRSTNKQGTLTFTLTLKPVDADGSVVEVHDKIKVSAPEPTRKGSIFYTTDDGTLSRTNPDQAELPLSSIDGTKADPEPNLKSIAS